ncbi:esterase/lipase family protein [Azospirillum canadense]|uniref:esterase/lipase family protein n=1 Tax=Azospirillum canadense TaxID=403962 RepID=UPI002226267D|nr:alpha/beta fold hydrolase [Azospirillum canadense]MCW2239162.1 pimeloyl-ACP methyl ester carboxylesterase [Azospirillum canadense]
MMRAAFRTWVAGAVLLVGVLLAGGCATPVTVERVDHGTVHQQITRNVLSANALSDPTHNVLRRWSLADLYLEKPEVAIADLHTAVAQGRGGADEVFALAEMAFLHAENRGGRPYYLASALYAYAFLFPGAADQPPSPYDPRFRLATDLYNRGLTTGLETEDRNGMAIQAASYRLPFGQLDVAFDSRELAWGGRQLTDFFPIAEVEVDGLDARYRQPGIGAPLAAGTTQGTLTKGFQVAPRVKTPVTALLRITDPRRQIADGTVRGQLELYPSSDTEAVLIDHQHVPLEVEYTSTLAYMLSGLPVSEIEFGGFLRGSLLEQKVPSRLVALEPYRAGRIPVVFVHGTASSAVRWAEMLNDLRGDPRIRDHFQFWFFSYETGNPVPYSAMLLRDALQNAVSGLDPSGQDPALHEMVVIGHSQGGLLTKMTAIDTGDRFWNTAFRKPPDELPVDPDSRDLLKRFLFIKPVPSVKRLIFIATPHGGSYVAGNRINQFVASLVRLPGNLLREALAVGKLDSTSTALAGQGGFGSVYGMTPGSVLVRALAATPIAPGVKAHSIIAVRGDGPIESGDDGVVEYKSAHIAGVESEYIVHSGHSTQGDPHTIEEVRRILLLHWAESCTKRQDCRPPGVAAPRVASRSP